MEPYHPSGYSIRKPEPTDEHPDPQYSLEFEEGAQPVPEELINGKEVEVQIDDRFQIFGHYRHPVLTFENSELEIEELIGHVPHNITIWY
jgi:hypothetical protein